MAMSLKDDAPLSRDELISEVVSIEWTMFQGVNNKGGRANCQDMPQTFYIMRSTQFRNWTDEMIQSYYDDLFEALGTGRNLLSEKYAYMMRSTAPDEWEQIKDIVPPVTPEKSDIVEKIIDIEMEWADDLVKRYPYFMTRARPVHTNQDNRGTSIETYSRGELSTYSIKTLKLMLEHFAKMRDEGLNVQEMVIADEAKEYGYASLEEAEKAIVEGRMSGDGYQ